MKKRFQFVRSNSALLEPIILAGTVFLLITSMSSLLFKIFDPDSMFPTFIGVAALIITSVYLLPKIKPNTEEKAIEIDSDKGECVIDGKKIEPPTEINIMRYGTEKDARFQIKFPKGEVIDSREYTESKRLLTLLPRTFPDAKTETHIVQSAVKTLVAVGLIAALIMFIIGMVV